MTDKDLNRTAAHPLQSFEWGEFRKKTGVKVVRGNSFQLTIHPIPFIGKTIGYLPKGPLPNKEMIAELRKVGKEHNCIFIQLEPNVQVFTSEESLRNTSEASAVSSAESVAERTPRRWAFENLGLIPAAHPLFTKYTFQLDLTKSEDELLESMHPKTRYNIKVAQRHGVEFIEDNSDEAFKEYLRLTFETTQRQGFYAHDEKYHRLMWETLKSPSPLNPLLSRERNKVRGLSAHLLLAKYEGKTLAAWILFVFKDTIYYPYGASSSEHKEVMASNLMMWEAIRFGKKLGLKTFDMWGALGPNPDPKDPWYGFHRFKEGYGGKLVKFVGSYDLVINPLLYELYKVLDKLRWLYLKLKRTR